MRLIKKVSIFIIITSIITKIIILLLLQTLQTQSYSQNLMDITIDFTEPNHPTVKDLDSYPYLRSITFIFPFFKQLNQSFSCLHNYITYLNDKPFVKIFIKPKGQEIKPRYQTVAVGGTFDHLHIGHQMLLLYSALVTEKKLIIGVTSDQMLTKKANKQVIQSLLMRINEVREFIKTFRPEIELNVVKLDDPYGPTLDQKQIDAIIVSPETYKGGQEINKRRIDKGFPQLIIQVCPIMAPIQHLTSIQMIENKISSTHIRSNLLAKNGLTLQRFSEYQNVWNELIQRINKITQKEQINNHLISRKWWDIIIKYYSQYWRYFHTNHHIAKMFRELRNIWSINQEYQKLTQIDRIVLEIAIFFHDIVYRPDIQTNEEDSANFAESFIDEIWGESKQKDQIKKQIIQKVKAAILCTRHHVPANKMQKILCDLDMSVLNEPLDKYKTYAFNIQREYRPLVKDEYPKKRTEFLQKILKGKYQFCWIKGEHIDKNIEWQLSYWKEHQSKSNQM